MRPALLLSTLAALTVGVVVAQQTTALPAFLPAILPEEEIIAATGPAPNVRWGVNDTRFVPDSNGMARFVNFTLVHPNGNETAGGSVGSLEGECERFNGSFTQDMRLVELGRYTLFTNITFGTPLNATAGCTAPFLFRSQVNRYDFTVISGATRTFTRTNGDVRIAALGIGPQTTYTGPSGTPSASVTPAPTLTTGATTAGLPTGTTSIAAAVAGYEVSQGALSVVGGVAGLLLAGWSL